MAPPGSVAAAAGPGFLLGKRMTPGELTAYLHDQIPLTHAMGVQVVEATPQRVRLSAPLQANRNPHGTVFGGSLATLGTLAGWVLLYRRLYVAGADAMLVVRRSELDYQAAAAGDVIAECNLSEPDGAGFVETLSTTGKARLQLRPTVFCDQRCVLQQSATYVAIAES